MSDALDKLESLQFASRTRDDFDRRLLSVRERDSFKMRHNTVGIMDDQSFFLCGTELGRLDVER